MEQERRDRRSRWRQRSARTTQDFGGGSEQDLQERIQEFRDRMQREGGGGFGGGAGGGFGGPGGAVIALGRMPKGFNINQPHGMLYFSDDNAGLDARPLFADRH